MPCRKRTRGLLDGVSTPQAKRPAVICRAQDQGCHGISSLPFTPPPPTRREYVGWGACGDRGSRSKSNTVGPGWYRGSTVTDTLAFSCFEQCTAFSISPESEAAVGATFLSPLRPYPRAGRPGRFQIIDSPVVSSRVYLPRYNVWLALKAGNLLKDRSRSLRSWSSIC